MDDNDPYRPIACSLHDRLESAATLGKRVRIVFRTPDGEIHETEDRLADVFTRGGEEFVETAGGELIRLDRLQEVDGVAF